MKQEKKSYWGGDVAYTTGMYTKLLYARSDSLLEGKIIRLDESIGYDTYTNLNKPGMTYSLVKGTYWDSMTILGKSLKNFGYESTLTISSWFPPKLDKGILQYCAILYFNPVDDLFLLAKAGAEIGTNTIYSLEPKRMEEDYYITSIVEKMLSFGIVLGCDAEYRIVDHMGLRLGCDLNVPFLSKITYNINRVEYGTSYSPSLSFHIFGFAGNLKPHVSGVYYF